MRSWRPLRITLLLVVLVAVAMQTWLTRARTADWARPLWVTIHPMAADDSPRTAAWVAGLTSERFRPLEAFLARESERHGLALAQPVTVRLGRSPASAPPEPPRDRAMLRVVAWSLRLRWWSWRHVRTQPRPHGDVQMYVRYHDPERSPRVAHSLGLQEGMIGVVHAFAHRRMQGSNQFVIAHELLHTLGASDKYDLATGLPIHPDGYAEPGRRPLHPQRRAEVMGGRRPVSAVRAETPRGLDEVVVGDRTAREVHWRRDPAP